MKQRSRADNGRPLSVAAVLVVAALLFAMFEFQDQLIFPIHAVGPPGPLPAGTERLALQTADGHTVHGVRVPPAKSSERRTLILGFGGNAWNGENVAAYLHQLYPKTDIVAFHYRGYAPSTGSPSADALLADAPLVYDLAVKRVKPERTIVVGFSIGSGVAARLAKERKLDGLILVTPFDSLKSVAQSIYPWLPIGPLFRHEIDAADALEGSSVPVAIVAAGRDEIVPAARTAALRARVPKLVFDRTIDRAGHNDVYTRAEFEAAMHEALAAVER